MLATASCTKKDVNPVSFNVSLDSFNFKVNDTVNFTFNGNPDYIVFYSGENGHKYAYRNRDTGTGIPLLSFSSQEKYGNHKNTMHLLVSTDFSGILYDSNEIRNATWTDITNRAKFDSTTFLTPSGNINLSDFLSFKTPIYVAFKDADQQDGVNSQRTWNITNLSMLNYLPDSSSFTILDIANSLWLGVNLLNPIVNWAQSSTLLSFSGGANTAPSNEAWLVSQPVNLSKVVPDVGVPIKKMTDPVLNSFYHIYTKPGNYTVVFDITNANANSSTTATRSLNITIH